MKIHFLFHPALFFTLCFLTSVHINGQVNSDVLFSTDQAASGDHGSGADLPANVIAEIQEGIALTEYNIGTGNNDDLQSPNRAQNLRFHYFSSGFKMEQRTDKLNVEDWTVSIHLQSISRDEGEVLRPSDGFVRERALNHLQYHHSAGFTVEYINDMAGMRQNFIVYKKPNGDGFLRVNLKISSELTPILSAKTEVTFCAVGASNDYTPKVHYNDLKVIDARGQNIRAWMVIKDSDLTLVIDDAGAAYPLTIDPLSTSAASSVESNLASAKMGTSVHTAGDVNGDGYSDIIVGVPDYDNGQSGEGAVFIYHGNASGIVATASAIVECNQAFAQMGNSVRSAGDVNGDGYSDIIVGAHLFDNGESNEGAAFIYHGSPSGIDTTATAILESNQADAFFGYVVSGAGDVNGDGFSDVIVGASTYDNGESDEGAAFIYHGSAGGINTVAVTQVESNQASAEMGYSVCGAGDVNGDGYSDIVVGIHKYDAGQTDEGAAFIYHGSASGTLTTPATTVESDQAGSLLGSSVSSAGDVNGDGYCDVIVSALMYTDGQTSEGAAFVYHGSAAGIGVTAVAVTQSNQNNAQMGYSIGTAGDVNGDGYSDIIVGAHLYDNGEIDEGAAFIYHGGASGIDTAAASIIEGNQAGVYMGFGVGVAGDVNGDGISDVIIGAPLYSNGQADEGAFSVYNGSANGLQNIIVNQDESDRNHGYMGYSVSGAGDVNGDGFSDVIVGVPGYYTGQLTEGAAFIYHGSGSGLSATPSAILESTTETTELGWSVSGAGDVNGDGYSDVVVGDPYYEGSHYSEGGMFVFHGGPGGVNPVPAAVCKSNQIQAQFGYSVSGAGDVNGDGYSDIIAGAIAYSNGESNEGGAFIYYGSATGIDTTAAVVIESNLAWANMGNSVSNAGDVNGDGYGDVVVGAFFYENGQTNEGAAFVYYGSANGISGIADEQIELNMDNAWMGSGVSSAGDVNGDGYSDVIVSAQNYSNGENREGAVFIYHGSATGLDTTAVTQFESNQIDGFLGWKACGAGDLNGDGYGDIILDSRNYSNGENAEGVAFVYHGSPNGVDTALVVLLENNMADANFSGGLSSAGDIDGDGYGDVIVGSPWYDGGDYREGAFFTYHGNENGSLYRNSRQYQSDMVTPIQTGSAGGSAFGMGHFARSNYGRTKVKLVWEVFGPGNGFSGNPITNSVAYQGESASWVDIGTTGLEIKELIAAVGSYSKWRVRVKYHPAAMLDGQAFSRWFYGGINDEVEMSLRALVYDFTAAALPDITADCEVLNLVPPTGTVSSTGELITATTATVLPITGQGTTVVIWTYDDGNGNVGIQSQTVIIDDVTAPVADSLSLPDLLADCDITSLVPPTATDNCAGVIIGTTTTGLPITSQGTTIITWTYDDGNGNTSTQTQTVVISDVLAPVTDSISLSDIVAECEVTALIPPTATDNCAGLVTGTTATSLPITAQGTTVVTWTFDDGNGNTSSQTQTVVISDALAPVADSISLTDILAECEVTSLIPPTATDNCAGLVTGTTAISLPITGQGTTVVTWTFDDGNGNTSTQTQNVIIDDVSPPVPDVITLPDLTAVCEIDTLTAPTATDNCGGSIIITNDAVLPITVNTVINWTYEDDNGNISTQTQDVVIQPVVATVSLSGIIATADQTATSYQWIDCDNENSPIPAETGQSYTATSNGTYAVIITIENCSDTSDCVAITGVGVEFNDIDEELTFYPNPSTDGIFNIRYGGTITKIDAIDMVGRIVAVRTDAQHLIIDASALASGQYTIRIYTSQGILLKKVIKLK